MFNNKFKFDAAADLAKSILEADVKAKMEALKGDQVKLDKNRNGKLDAQDFKMLRGEKKVNEAEANYQSSYRVGKTANFKPKASDVGQGRKITGKMGKYGKQPDDDNMVEPPADHKVGDVKTDPSAVVPGHSTIAAKLHLQTLPKDAEGNPIVKGARKVNAADLVAKRKAMMAADEKAKKDQKNEEVESLEEKNWIAGAIKHPGGLHKALGVPQDEKIPASKVAAAAEKGGKIGKMARLAQTLKGLKKEEYVEEGMEDTLHPAGAALLKHIKPQHHNLYKPHLAKGTFNGSYGDRTAVLKAAKDAGHLKMDLRKQNEEVESITEGKMDKMTLSGLWHKHAQHSYMSDQGYGLGSGSMHHNDHAATAIENHVRKHYGNKVADDMVAHSEHHVAHAEYAGKESAPHHEKEAEKLRNKHGIHGDLYGEEVEHDTDMINERELTSGETKEKERIVHGMKKSLKGFKARYGDRAKEVMYATATKQAKKD